MIAFLCGDNKKIKFYQTKREFASSYINDRRLMMEEKVEELIDIYIYIYIRIKYIPYAIS